jgi:uncharacterized repeat protein (TIGR03803 family)
MRRFLLSFHLFYYLLAPLAVHATGLSTLYTIKGIIDGATPHSAVLVSGKSIFGTTYAGGAAGLGAIYERNATTGKVTILYSFSGGANGANPAAGLVQIGKMLYGTTSTGGSTEFPRGTLFGFDLTTHALTTINSGCSSIGDLIVGSGKIYGAAACLGNITGEILFSIDPATNGYSVLYTFATDPFFGPTPQGGPTEAGGKLYGTLLDTSTNQGSIYTFDIKTGTESGLYTFGAGSTQNDGLSPAGTLAVVGSMLYGATEAGGANGDGTIFGINLATGAESIVYSFTGGTDGVSPAYGVAAANGLLYGVTGGYAFGGPQAGETLGFGTLFSVDPANGTETTLHSFSGRLDGGTPSAGVTVTDGVVYGTAPTGGEFGAGTVFYYRAGIKYFGVLHNFAGLSGTVVPSLFEEGGELYGVAADGGSHGAGLAFKVSTAHGNGKSLLDFQGGTGGAYPGANLLRLDGVLYGTTTYGGAAGAGTIYSIDPASGKETVVAEFAGGAKGQFPGNLVSAGGMIYGTTGFVNDATAGTVFRLNPKTGRLFTLVNFTGTQGNIFNANNGTPNSLVAVGKTLYGTIASGGFGAGSIFSIDTVTGAIASLHQFECSDGCYPQSAMISVNGTLYGTTSAGGVNSGGGTIFSLDPTTGALTTLYSFVGTAAADGYTPEGPLLSAGGMFYGTTVAGGTGQGGTVFQFDPASSTISWLYNFNNTAGAAPEGYGPEAGLVDIGGTLYGTTSAGGAGNAGAVFSLTP